MNIDLIGKHYGLNFDSLSVERLSQGADINATVYKVLDKSGKSYFVKERRQDDRPFSKSLARVLEQAGISEALVPMQTLDGKVFSLSEEKAYHLFPFIKGKDGFSTQLSKEQWITLGQAMRKLHGIVNIEGVPAEDYSDRWRQAFKQFLDLDTPPEPCDIFSTGLFASISVHRKLLEDLIERAEFYASKINKSLVKNVLCHSDLHGGNILVDGAGKLYIIDWDEPILAPKEKDLMFIGGGVGNVWNNSVEEEWFYAGYGPVEIDLNLMAYFRFERIVRDFVEFCDALCGSVGSVQARETMLRHFTEMFAPHGVIEIAFATERQFPL